MPRRQTKSLLDIAKSFHQRLSEIYARLREQAQDEKAKLLVEYLSEHETRLQAVIDEFEKDVPQHALERWFKYTPQDNPLTKLGETDLPGEVSTERLTEIALKLDQALIDWYHSIADRAVPDEVKATFERLAELEQKEGRELARDVQAFEKD